MKKKSPAATSKSCQNLPISPSNLLEDLRHMIEETRKSIALTVNAGLTNLYWHIGNRIRQETLQDKRAEYGRKIVATVSRQLAVEYGSGFSEANLRRMIQFSEVFPDEQIVASLMRQLS
jgi:hypothetical protein